MKRLLALIAGICLMVSGCLAEEEPIATYQLPQEAEVSYITGAAAWTVPEGLEPMYALMQNAMPYSSVYLVRMKNGRALASVSSSYQQERTPQELLDRWPQVLQNIALEGVRVDAAASTASVETMYGRELLHMKARLLAGEEGELALSAEAFAFFRGDEAIEVWGVAPEAGDQPDPELADDVQDLKAFLESLNFGGTETVNVDSTPYKDPAGRFSLQIVKGSIVITGDTPKERVEAVKKQYVAKNKAGADIVFDRIMEYVATEKTTLIFTPDMKGVVQLFCAEADNFAGATPDMIASIAEYLRQSLEERYEAALLLGNGERVRIDGAENAVLNYWLHTGEMDVRLDIISCVLGEKWLCEADVFVSNGDKLTRDILHAMLEQTLDYHVTD